MALGDTRLGRAIRDLHPAYFALVMATGIISIAAHKLEHERIALALFVVNIAAYVALGALALARLLLARERVLADLQSHVRGPAYLTLTAGTGVLGTQVLLIAERPLAAFGLWSFGAASWLIFVYGFLTAATIAREKPGLSHGIGGSWLLVVVATQSLVILGTLIFDREAALGPGVQFLHLALFLLGGVLYLVLVTLIFYRFLFFKLAPSELNPPYWVNMGVEAISALAAATLVAAAPAASLLGPVEPTLRLLGVAFWAVGAWWIPLLAILSLWRHLVHHVPLRYEPAYWSAIFPLGMFSAGTFEIGRMEELDALKALSAGFFWIALSAWALCAIGLFASMLGIERPRSGSEAS